MGSTSSAAEAARTEAINQPKKRIRSVSTKKMMGSISSAAEAARTEATNQPKKTGPKREKSQAQKDAHNESCRKSRLKLTRKREETKEELEETKKELEETKKELEENNFKLQCIQEFKRGQEKQILGTGMSAKMWEVTMEHARTCVLDKRMQLYPPPGSQQKSGVVFNIVGQVTGLLSECQYVTIDKLSETEKIEAQNLVISAFEHWEEVISFDDEASLIGGTSNLANVPYTSSTKTEVSNGSKFLASQNMGGFNYAQPSASSPDIISSIFSVGSMSGLDDLLGIENMGLRYDQTLSYPGQVTNSLICDIDITPTFCDEDLRFFDSDLQPQSLGLESVKVKTTETEVSNGSNFLASQNMGGFNYAQPSASSPDIISSIFSVGSMSGLDDLLGIENMGLRYDQTLSYPGQVTNSLICDIDITPTFCDEDLRFFDSDLQPQSLGLESVKTTETEVSNGSKFLASQNMGGFNYAQPSASSPDIISIIFSGGSMSGLDELLGIENMGLRYDQTLSYPGQVTNSLICDIDITLIFCDEDLRCFDSDLQPQSPGLESVKVKTETRNSKKKMKNRVMLKIEIDLGCIELLRTQQQNHEQNIL
ncbi:hypothetical protein REPUB_Repub07fG0175500 [Reevesia pubescens]